MNVSYESLKEMGLSLHIEVRPADGIPDLSGALASESLTPGSGLEGGELLISTGLLLTPPAFLDYVENIKRAGASLLVFSVGPRSPYPHVPPQLLEACTTFGLALASADETIAPSTIVRTLYEALAKEQHRSLKDSVDLFAELCRTAGQGVGPSGIVSAWAKRTHSPVVVLNRAGRPIAGDPHDLRTDETMLQDFAAGNRTALHPLEHTDGFLAVTPLGATRPRGYLVAPEPGPTTEAKAVLVSLLSLELERLWLFDEPERLRRAETVGSVLTAGNEAAARSRLRAAGLTDRLFHVAVIDPVTDDASSLMAELALTFSGGLARTRGPYVEIIVGQDDPALNMLEKFIPSNPVGIGAALTPGHLAESRIQALAAIHASASAGRPVMFKQGVIFDWLADTVDPTEMRAFSDAILAPIENAVDGETLILTLKAWVEENCAQQVTCDRLGIHRHTLRARLRRIETLISQPLDALQTKTELWIAISSRPTSEWPSTGAAPPKEIPGSGR